MTPDSRPPVWLRGAVPDVPAELQPAAHSLLQSVEDIDALDAPSLTGDQLWATPGGVASVGWHILHIAGATARLVTYARGEELAEDQRRVIERERNPVPANENVESLLQEARAALTTALAMCRSTAADQVRAPRVVGRSGLPSTVGGLLFHAGEHAWRHAAQAMTTARIVRALPEGGRP